MVVLNAVWSAGILPCEVRVLCVCVMGMGGWGLHTLFCYKYGLLCDEYENVQYLSAAFESAFDCIQ